MGKGALNIYKYLQTQFINTSRYDVTKLLKSEPNYLLVTKQPLLKAKPIVEKAPNIRYQVDLIDVSYIEKHNKHYNYILNCVDVFSRYSWLRLLKRKTAVEVRNAFISITTEATIEPTIVQTDNGTEFMEKFDEYLKERNIKHIFNATYSPTQNAIVERSNREVRKILNNVLFQRNTKVYYDVIKEIQDAKNNSYNGKIKAIPIQLWTPDKIQVTKRIMPESITNSLNDKRLSTAYEMNKVSNARMEQYKKSDNYKKDDYVLLKMSTIFSSVRKMIKAGESKKLPIQYAPILFQIHQVITSRKKITRNRYILKNVETNQMLSKYDGKFKHVTANDIIMCDSDDFGINMTKAMYLDNVHPILKYDLIYC
jgi:transposase InsO family protein